MDPIAHTFTGAALAASGLRRATPLATAALIIGANAPDLDVAANFAGNFSALAFRRGWTHGILALIVLPLVVTGALLLWDRWRRGKYRDRDPARPRHLLGVAALGVATHPTLDWLNNYGLRWLMPFDGRWFYGDALFIVDPWVWLVLGGVLFLAYSQRPASLAAWAAFWLFGSLLVFATPLVPPLARLLWVAGLASLLAARVLWTAPAARLETGTRAAVALIAIYMAVAALANIPARAEVRSTLASRGIGPVEDIMIGPAPANPFRGSVVASTPNAYYVGEWRWLERPRLDLSEDVIHRLPADDPVVAAAGQTPDARQFLIWSRYPYFEVESSDAGYVVRIRDARYADAGRLGGLSVRLDLDLHAVP